MRKKWKSIFFDFDGVLVLSEPLHFAAWQKVVEEKKLFSEGFSLQKVIGISDFDIAKNFIKKNHLSMPEEDLIHQKQKYFHRLYAEIPYPRGRNEFIREVAKSFLLSIVSSSSTEDIQEILQAQGIFHYFSWIVGGNDSQKHKPHPEPYLLALERSHLPQEDVLVIEDSPAGITSALEAGIEQVVGLKNEELLFTQDFAIPFYKDFFEIARGLLGKDL